MELAGSGPARPVKTVNGFAVDRVKSPMARMYTAMTMAVTTSLFFFGACVEISGGAVELSWSFQTFQGAFIEDDCADTFVEEVRLSWREPDSDVNSGTTDFPCDAFRGITDFVIEPGDQLLEITPICQSGNPALPRSYEVPAPIRRNVREREVVTLDSLLIVIDDFNNAQCACCDSPADSSTAITGEQVESGSRDRSAWPFDFRP